MKKKQTIIRFLMVGLILGAILGSAIPSLADPAFQEPQLVLGSFGYEAGGWRVDKHPRFLADMTGDGRKDIVGFGDAGVYVAAQQR